MKNDDMQVENSMDESSEKALETVELRIKGRLVERGVETTKRQSIDELTSRGYGTVENSKLVLSFYEALYLMDKGILEVIDEKDSRVEFQKLLRHFEDVDKNAWAKYLAYRDLRSRGYVVREGFGLGVDFRVYERGEYNKDTAKYLILNVQEGKPISLESLSNALKRCRSLKKELILAVMNRRGEVVYYSVSQLNLM